MFYTGRNRAEAGRVQRIGLATSDDLASWTRTSNSPVLEADPQLFATDGVNGSTSTDCRDPWEIRHENQWLMFFTASAATGPRGGRGRVGMAVSSDLLHWDQQSTVAGSGEFGEIEVPQVVQVNGHWVMFFCTAQHNQAPRHQGPAWNGTHYYRASAPTGPFKLAPGEPLLADSAGTLYAARYVADPWIAPCLLAWRRWDEPGHFVGDLTDPIAFTATPDGQLSATW